MSRLPERPIYRNRDGDVVGHINQTDEERRAQSARDIHKHKAATAGYGGQGLGETTDLASIDSIHQRTNK